MMNEASTSTMVGPLAERVNNELLLARFQNDACDPAGGRTSMYAGVADDSVVELYSIFELEMTLPAGERNSTEQVMGC
jgi:hypothetical protein